MFTLSVTNLEKRFGRHPVFASLNLRFEQATLGIGGPNGSGKSTFLRCLAGLLRPSDGQIQWLHRDREINLRRLRQYIGFVAPSIAYYPDLSVRENLELVVRMRGDRTRTEAIDPLLESYGMLEHRLKTFSQLSSGQQQRIKLAAAMIHDPELLFLDEPGTNLDERGRELIFRTVSEMVENGRQVILASNDERELDLCTQVVRLDRSSGQTAA